MHVETIAAFNSMASVYDHVFSDSLLGKSQRARTRKWLSAFLADKKKLRILEINCGTGEDAWWLASLGHEVVATDASPAMIETAQKKEILYAGLKPEFLPLAFDQLSGKLSGREFDLVFSNFSGLNCIPGHDIQELGPSLHKLLAENGHLALVIFGKYCCWETFYYLLKGKPGKAFRRWGSKPSIMKAGPGQSVPVWYYSPNGITRLLEGFRRLEKRPVGLFIPPSYLEQTMCKRTGLLRFLQKMEDKAGSAGIFSQWADHQYLLLKKC